MRFLFFFLAIPLFPSGSPSGIKSLSRQKFVVSFFEIFFLGHKQNIFFTTKHFCLGKMFFVITVEIVRHMKNGTGGS